MRTPILSLAAPSWSSPSATRAFLWLSLLVAACTSGSGQLGQETRDVTKFDAIEVGGPFQVNVQVGPEARVEILGDDNVVPLVRAEVRGTTLHLELPNGRIVTKLPLEAIISTPALVELEAGGASNVTVAGVTGTQLEIEASGASRVSLAGEVQGLEAEVSGASSLAAGGLTAATARVEASGASDAEVRATTSLSAQASGASTIRYHGKPGQIDQDASGASTIEAAGD